MLHTTVKKIRYGSLVQSLTLCAFLAFIFSCSGGDGGSDGGTSSNSSASSGGVGFSLMVLKEGEAALADQWLAEVDAEPFDCKTHNIATVEAQVYVGSVDSEEVAKGGPWKCEDNEGTIENVLAGTNRIVRIIAKEKDSDIAYFEGTSKPIDVIANRVVDAGIIYLEKKNNRDPMANDDKAQTKEDTPVYIPVKENDNDWDDDSLIVSNVTSGSNGTVAKSGDGVTYTPKEDWYGTDSFTYEVSDGTGTDTAEVTVTVESVNDQPELDPIGNKHVMEATLLEFTVTAEDKADNDMLKFNIGDKPTDASFEDHGDGTATFSWIPNYDDSNNYPVLFRVTDVPPAGQSPLSDHERVTITVGDVNRPPEFQEKEFTCTVDGIEVDPPDIQIFENEELECSFKATDPDGHSMRFNMDKGPAMASFVDNGDGTARFNWTPDFGTIVDTEGNYPVEVKVTDEPPAGLNPLSRVTRLDVTVGNVCRWPKLDPIGGQHVIENEVLSIHVTGSDPDGGELTYNCSSTEPNFCQYFDPVAQTFIWRPTYNDARKDPYKVTFTVTDDCKEPRPLSHSEPVEIYVGDVCREPTLTLNCTVGEDTVDPANISLDEGQEQELICSLTATDPDGGVLTYDAKNLPEGSYWDSEEGIFTWSPDHEQAGEYKVTFTVEDDCEDPVPLSDSKEVTITVVDVCRKPTLTLNCTVGEDTVDPANISLDEGQKLICSLTATDPDGGVLTYDAENLPEGHEWDSEEGIFTWSPDYEQAGEYKVTFIVEDDCEDPEPLSDSKEVTITVIGVCRSPVLDPIGAQQVYEGELLEFTITGSDPDGDELTYSASNLPAGASFSGQTFSWSAGCEAEGDYDVTFTITDSCKDPGPLSYSEEVTITVIPFLCNNPPEMTVECKVNGEVDNTYEYTLWEDYSTLECLIEGTDLDVPCDTLECKASGRPDNAEFERRGATSWEFVYEPSSETMYAVIPTYSVIFELTDSCEQSIRQEIIINIGEPE